MSRYEVDKGYNASNIKQYDLGVFYSFTTNININTVHKR